ncbi:hypothetical protein [Microcoleus vaginatus]|uniref:hypothetical protein n=1 Tax=Microcoleus vaginatus TaxID=119532 RepID=UPI001F61490B
MWQQDGLPTSSIGDKLQQVGGTLTGASDRMEARGLVRERHSRSSHLADRLRYTNARRIAPAGS